MALAMVVVLIAVAAVLAPAAQATKFYDSTIGTSSASGSGVPPTPSGTAFGGTFGTGNGGVGDIGVNDPSITTDGTGNSGWVYVVDRGHNRLQAFNSAGVFQFAVGRDVIASSVNETHILTVAATAGQFRLSFNGQTTGDLDWNISPANLDNALDALVPNAGPTVVDTNVVVTGAAANGGSVPVGRYSIAYGAAFAAADQPATSVLAGTTPLTGSASVENFVDGTNAVPGNISTTAFEKCTVAGHCKAGTTGAAIDDAGELDVAMGLDIDQATGDVFVRERNNNARVEQFAADGDHVRAFGWDVVSSGPGDTGGFETCNTAAGDICKNGVTATNNGTGNPGQFASTTTNGPNGVAVAPVGAPNAGIVYVANQVSCRIEAFAIPASPTGVVAAGTPFGVNAGSELPFADDALCSIQNATSQPREVAAGADGEVYVNALAGSSGGMLKRYDTTASAFLVSTSTGGDSNQLGDGGGAITGLAVDPATDHLLLERNGALGIVELDLSSKPDTIGSSHIVERHVSALGVTPLALGAGGGRWFAATSSSIAGTGAGHRVLVLDDDGVDPDPVVTITPATDVEASTATLNGTVDPVLTSAFQTFYQWQVSKDGVVWTDATGEALVGATGFAPTSVTANVTGLEANTTYRVRIRTQRKPDAGFAYSPELTVTTDAAAPVVATRPVQRLADREVQLVGRLHPGGLPTSYWFEWGDDNYGNQTPVPAASLTAGTQKTVIAGLGGLEPERVYHYRLCAKNALAATKRCGDDAIFMTRPAAVSPTGDRAYEMVLPADKPLRRGGESKPVGGPVDMQQFSTGMPSAGDGQPAFMSHLFAGVTSADSGAGSTAEMNYEVHRRGPGGVWTHEAILNTAPPSVGGTMTSNWIGATTDLSVSTWKWTLSLFSSDPTPNEWSLFGTRELGDSGGPRSNGWYPFLDHAWTSGAINHTLMDGVLAGDDRIAIGLPEASSGPYAATVMPADDDVSPGELSPAQTKGGAVFVMDRADGWRPSDLVSECTGTAASATLLPSRDDGGTSSGPSGSFTISAASYTADSPVITVFDFAGDNTSNVRVGHVMAAPAGLAGSRVTEVTDSTHFTVSPAPTTSSPFTSVAGGQDTAALADDRLTTRACEQGSPTDVRGAVLGSLMDPTEGSGQTTLGNSDIAAMSADGRRVFFTSPDPRVLAGRDRDVCDVDDTAVEGGSRCAPQLFLRQYADDGTATVRWLSRPADALFFDGGGSPQMRPEALSGVAFEAASADGRYVYFRTNTPLTADDPNGGLDPLVTASGNSWDLYRYDLGADLDADPASGDPADRLLRISGGQAAAVGAGDLANGSATITNVAVGSGAFVAGQVIRGDGIPAGTTITAVGTTTLTLSGSASASSVGAELRAAGDPNTNCAVVATAGPQAGSCWGKTDSGSAPLSLNDLTNRPNGAGNVLRLLSDDGKRGYVVTTAGLPGIDSTPPGGSATENTQTAADAQINATSRNLYAFEVAANGGVTYRFVARLPFSLDGFDACASSAGTGNPKRPTPFKMDKDGPQPFTVNCLRGSRSGDAAVIFTDAQLTGDDDDSAADVYVYDAESHELSRISAPGPDSDAYPCLTYQETLGCNADLGYHIGGSAPDSGFGLLGYRHWNISQDQDGRLTDVFFESRLPLVDEDENAADDQGSGGMDVYQWSRSGSRLALVTPGDADGDSAFYSGNSLDGRDVFFATAQRISPWELEEADHDIYNATTRTDLRPDPVAPPAICQALSDACQGGGFDSVSSDTKTQSSSESDNAKAEARKTLAVSGLSAKARRKASRTGRLPVKVRASSTGRVSLTVKAKLGRKVRRVGRASKRAVRGRAMTVNVRLSSAAKKRLRSGKRLRVTVEVRQPGVRTRTTSILLPGVKS
jgi:hypothetical protein